jgi:shikimate dehydrogenase
MSFEKTAGHSFFLPADTFGVPPIDGATRLLGVFGHPVEHSLSPAMHNAAIAALSLHYVYIPFPVPPDAIGSAIRSLTALQIIGVNLTIPHKESVLPYLDTLSEEAQAVGAVNTVLQENGRLHGFNTDGDGFAAPLRQRGFALSERRAVVLGAGGAARSVVYRLVREGAEVVLVNRTIGRAERLREQINHALRRKNTVGRITCMAVENIDGVRNALASAHLLVNTTPVGMYPHTDALPSLPPHALHPELLVYELIYNPVETRLLAEARAVRAGTLNGVQMLVQQGAAAFRLWTQTDPPTEVMEQAVLAHLHR